MVRSGNCEEAVPWFEKARTLRPDDVRLLNSLGQCLIHVEDFPAAEEVYSTSYRLNQGQAHVKQILTELERLRGLEAQRRNNL